MKAPAQRRAPKTAFKPGQSDNPGGRPKVLRNLQELAREHTEDAIKVLVRALKVPRERVAAAGALLDRGYGRPLQTQNVRVIRRIEDLSDEELAALAGVEEKQSWAGIA